MKNDFHEDNFPNIAFVCDDVVLLRWSFPHQPFQFDSTWN
jgi:hypothetical protein